ncbi:Aminomethyltransferase [BD1-7 clade bacterium]|uniref:aminomethyltransferase n=1 Tax=BD1-7 clade bacterium TaxID=2029982 RepID=A0A5S9QTG3_9GAMM|nr:Aminomethyltransferase [BD1-7 clade bacterium]CAA0122593.1 Aminomethyltransferase [BD1-7 clade bacterium]
MIVDVGPVLNESVIVSTELKTTPLNQWHIDNGAKMVPFAGYNMPVQYPMGVLKEHLHTREAAGLFDVSHMGQVQVTGDNVAEVLESIFPANLADLDVGKQCYSLLLKDDGGVVDDLMICRREIDFILVVNADRKSVDIPYLKKLIGDRAQVTYLDDRALLALQGPKAASVLRDLGADISDMVFMDGKWVDIDHIECWVTRSGYTGEDGFELSVANDKAVELAKRLVAHSDVEPIGLGARDSLRLEAGLCLYGHELNEQLNPVDASLNWAIAKDRRAGGAREGGFVGADIVLEQMAHGSAIKRVGLLGQGRAPVREGANLFTEDGAQIGHVTSGGFGPSLQKPVAMGYIDSQCAGLSVLYAEVRGKKLPVEVVRTPFVPSRYYRG